jgi:hypothetical protein
MKQVAREAGFWPESFPGETDYGEEMTTRMIMVLAYLAKPPKLIPKM